jgi:holo-[acyl-carrier protein] synthase
MEQQIPAGMAPQKDIKMVIGIGIDIIEISRIKKSIERFGDRFLDKIFTSGEVEYCMSKANKFQHFAARFSAKEAVAKALSTGWNNEFSWQNIEVFNAPTGMPYVKLTGKLEAFLADGKELKISMSHSTDYVTCVAIIYKQDQSNLK